MRMGVALALTAGATIASAQLGPLSSAAVFDRAALVPVGHEAIAPDPTIRRYTGMIAALGAPNTQGKVYTFTPAPVGPRNFPLSPDDLRGWRMTVLSGKRFGEVFRVSGNTTAEITVNADNGPLDGLDVRDVFVIESIDANGASMFALPAAAAPASGI